MHTSILTESYKTSVTSLNWNNWTHIIYPLIRFNHILKKKKKKIITYIYFKHKEKLEKM
jgi:hypothetical protein